MKGGKRRRKIIPALLCAVLTLAFSISLQAADDKNFVKQEIVFLLDASNSMNELETNVATQAVILMRDCLTSEYRAGFVSFDTDIQSVLELSEERAGFHRTVTGTTFKGYSNAGAGLKKALSLFSETENVPRAIVLVSDGEIIQSTDGATQESIAQFQAAAGEAAARGVVVNTMIIGEKGSVVNVLTASEETGGSIHWANSRAQILTAAEEIVFTSLGVRQSAVAAGGAQNGRVNITLPDAEMSRGKILLTSDFPLHNVTAAANATDVQVITGERYATVELLSPTQTGVSVAFDAAAEGTIQAKLISEYQVVLEADVVYPEVSASEETQDPPVITVTATGSGNAGALWQSPVFDGKRITLDINGASYPALIKDGRAQVTYDAAETDDYTIGADFTDFGGNFLSVTPAQVHSARPVIAPPPGIDYRPLIIILSLLALALLSIFLIGRRTARRKSMGSTGVVSNGEKTPPRRFTGKLNIYVTHMPDDRDVPPQSFNLYRENREKIGLHYILSSCGIDLGDADDREIVLRPAAGGALNVANNCNGTVLKNRDVMVKGKSFDVHYEEKVTITFDNECEVLLHYKNVKPSERS